MALINPEVSGINILPNEATTDVQLNTTIHITFNTDIAQATINERNIQIKDSLGAIVPITMQYYPFTRSIEIHNLELLQSENNYDIIVLGNGIVADPSVDGVTDILGNPMLSNFVLQFTTGTTVGTPYVDPINEIPLEDNSDSEPFDIYTVYPSVDSFNVSTGKIMVKFNKPIDPASVKDLNIYIIKRANL